MRHQGPARREWTDSPEAARAIADELARRVDGEVRFDRGSRALYLGPDHADIGRQAGERVLLPVARHAPRGVAALSLAVGGAIVASRCRRQRPA